MDWLLGVQGCPCTLDTICRGADNPGYWGPECEWLRNSYPGMWYLEHGGEPSILPNESCLAQDRMFVFLSTTHNVHLWTVPCAHFLQGSWYNSGTSCILLSDKQAPVGWLLHCTIVMLQQFLLALKAKHHSSICFARS